VTSPTPDRESQRREQSDSGTDRSVLFRHRGWCLSCSSHSTRDAGHDNLRFRWESGSHSSSSVRRPSGRRRRAGTVTRRRSRGVQRLVTYGSSPGPGIRLHIGNFLIWMGFVTISGVLWILPIAVLLFALEYELIVRYEEGVLESFSDASIWTTRTNATLDPRPPRVSSLWASTMGEALQSEISTFLQYAVLILAFWIKSHGRGKRAGRGDRVLQAVLIRLTATERVRVVSSRAPSCSAVSSDLSLCTPRKPPAHSRSAPSSSRNDPYRCASQSARLHEEHTRPFPLRKRLRTCRIAT